jgi:hypothetical protein
MRQFPAGKSRENAPKTDNTHLTSLPGCNNLPLCSNITLEAVIPSSLEMSSYKQPISAAGTASEKAPVRSGQLMKNAP